jgi:predicted alpha/beta superfamily hydrolase
VAVTTAPQRHPTLAAALLLAITSCSTPSRDPIPEHETLTINSTAVGEERRISVYTPKGYDQDSTKRFPVLYMPDGGIGEDFPHIVATIEAMIEVRTIPPMLVVGIENTKRRRDLTGPTRVDKDREIAPEVGGSAQFRAFIRDELIPDIERRYRCNEERAIVGESLAGLFVIETMLLEPKLFDRYIAVSPSLGWNNQSLVRNAQEHLVGTIGHKMRLYLTNADEEDIAPHAAELARKLEENAPSTLRWVYEPHPEEQHHTIFRAVKKAAFSSALSR